MFVGGTGVAVGTGDEVAVGGIGVAVGAGDGVLVGGIGVAVAVGVFVGGIGVAVAVGVLVGGTAVAVAVGVGVLVGGTAVAVAVGVGDGVLVGGTGVGVAVTVGDSVALGWGAATAARGGSSRGAAGVGETGSSPQATAATATPTANMHAQSMDERGSVDLGLIGISTPLEIPHHSHFPSLSHQSMSMRPSSTRAACNSCNVNLYDFLWLHGSHNNAKFDIDSFNFLGFLWST